MYMCVIGISRVSEQSCICVLLVSVWKLSSHVYVCYWCQSGKRAVMYMCVIGISQESEQSCTCVLLVSVR